MNLKFRNNIHRFISKQTIVVIMICLTFLSCKEKKKEAIGGIAHRDHTIHEGHSAPDDSLKKALELLALSPEKTVFSPQKTVRPEVKELSLTTGAYGYITADQRLDNKVAARTGGRIERLYTKYNYQYIKKGQKIMDIYSPEILTYQEEYLYLIKDPNSASLIEEAKRKLLLLGLSELQIEQLERSGQTGYTISIYSPNEGYIFFNQVNTSATASQPTQKATEGMSGMAMPGMKAPQLEGMRMPLASSGSEASLQEGMYVNKGQTLFTVNSLKKVWAIIAFEDNTRFSVNEGDSVTLSPENSSEVYHSKIALIEPVYKPEQKLLQARVYLDNPENILFLNSLLRAEIKLTSRKMLTIPESSVLDLGQRKIVWVKKENGNNGNQLFVVREIQTGVKAGGRIEILSGIDATEEAALEAGYLLDRESIVQP